MLSYQASKTLAAKSFAASGLRVSVSSKIRSPFWVCGSQGSRICGGSNRTVYRSRAASRFGGLTKRIPISHDVKYPHGTFNTRASTVIGSNFGRMHS